ncbi:TPA: stage V sporulation protein S [Candidatus Bipolaricaulota bacterium]|nr:stage V sporulation protein S [Candidatus Bipolaricaulota bacterium]
MAVLKVSSHSNPIATAGALANTIRHQGWAEIQVIGPKAVNQAIKAIAIARSYIASSGIDLITVPEFVEVVIGGQERTAIRLEVRPRNPLAQFSTPAPAPSSSPPAQPEPGPGLEPESGPEHELKSELESEPESEPKSEEGPQAGIGI